MSCDDHYSQTREFHRISAIEREGFYDARDGKPLGHSRWQRRVRQQVSSCINNITNRNSQVSSLLDVGCGNGDFTLELANQFPQLRKLVGTDFTSETLDLAKKAAEGNSCVSFQQADLLSLPMNDNAFDISVCVNVLHHILKEDLGKALGQLARVTSDYLILEIKNNANFYYRYIASKTFEGIHVYPTTISTVEEMLLPHSFNLRESHGVFLLNSLSPLVVLLFERNVATC
ncbi:MAG: class I SAM-dependent methyltransferase [Ekhidna sp.]